MEKIGDSLKEAIREKVQKFLAVTKNKEIFLVSHFDTDGITSATIMIQTLRKLDRKFSVKILKSLEEKFIRELPKDKVILFLDLASGSLKFISEEKIEDIFIIDHHEISSEFSGPPEGIEMINPWFSEKEKMSSSGLVYLFCKEILGDHESRSLAKLAVLGMIGDLVEESMDLLGKEIFENSDIQKRKGLMIYPSTRPLNRILEYNSHPFIPGVTGNSEGVIDLLRQSGIEPEKGKYKSIIELNDSEMKKLTTAIMLRSPKTKDKDIIGNIYLLKFFNRLEDARELSAMINACSRLGASSVALSFCLEISNARKKAEEIHAKYKQHLVSGLNLVSKMEKIESNGLVIINARDEIMDTLIGTIASILSSSGVYEEGTIITTMAYYENKIKVSTRISGRESNGKNLREILEAVVGETGGETGGHKFAAGCIISREKEKEFIETLQKNLEVKMVKVE